MARVGGQITVFISMVMMCVFALLCCLVESARMEGARWYLQMAASSSMDSVFGQYHRPLWDGYRLLFLEYEAPEAAARDFVTYLTSYLETGNWYPMTVSEAQTEELLTAADDNGTYLDREILDYMRYGIWKLDFDAESVPGLWNSITEAGAVRDIAGSYRGHANRAIRLERALEAVDESLSKQEVLKSRGISALLRYDGPAFRDAAGRLLRELGRMPGLVAQYRKQADALAAELAASRREFSDQAGALSEPMRELLDQEIRQYEAYTALDGEHRLEIEQKEVTAAGQIPLIEALIDEAMEVEHRIDEWDDDEEDDGPDLAALWNPVRRSFETISVNRVSFVHGIADKEKEGWLKQAETMLGSGLLELVIPAGQEVSGAVLDLTEAPSAAAAGPGGAGEVSLTEHLLVNEYCGMFFPSFLSAAGNYEMEYLLAGKESDRENLKQTVGHLIAVREGLNLLYLLSSPEKRTEANNLAMMITGAGAVTPLHLVVTFLILCVWAMGESMMDIRGLLAGKRVVMLKTDHTWTLTLEKLLAMGSSREIGTGGGEDGFGYLSWLKFLLITEDITRQNYRIMDMIQKNIRQNQDDFRIRNCVYQVRINTRICGKHLFFALPFVDKLTGGGDLGYPMEIATARNY